MSEADPRRRFPRRPIRVCVEATDDNRNLSAWTRDVGGGGLCFVSCERYEDGESLALTVHLPDRGPIELGARIVWTDDCEGGGEFLVGVSFTAITDEDRSVLSAFADDCPNSKQVPVPV